MYAGSMIGGKRVHGLVLSNTVAVYNYTSAQKSQSPDYNPSQRVRLSNFSILPPQKFFINEWFSFIARSIQFSIGCSRNWCSGLLFTEVYPASWVGTQWLRFFDDQKWLCHDSSKTPIILQWRVTKNLSKYESYTGKVSKEVCSTVMNLKLNKL